MSAVDVSTTGALGTVTLTRPALDREVKQALLEALTGMAADAAVRAVVLTGNGSAFCVGQDLNEHAAGLDADPSTAFDTVTSHYSPIVRTIATMPKPVIAAINGACVGAGLGFALACDLRVFADDATFATAFTAIGLTCDSGLSLTLTRAVGEARSKELVLLGTRFGAAEAVGWGIAATVVPAADVVTTATDLGARLAAGPTLAYAASKELIRRAFDTDLEGALAGEDAGQRRLGLTADHQGAVAAFLAKQKPTFAGR
jgi:2-(1,2-epoxy-1,2-dihydrophenyl)acetyl-CoA isomerase